MYSDRASASKLDTNTYEKDDLLGKLSEGVALGLPDLALNTHCTSFMYESCEHGID
jgi:hypothetical protein